jgi:colicin import membrane protein
MAGDEESVANALEGWRKAERDLATANAERAAAAHAVEVAAIAEEAAVKTADSARLALEAATAAEESARATAEAARAMTRTARSEETGRIDNATEATRTETTARDAYRIAEERARRRQS